MLYVLRLGRRGLLCSYTSVRCCQEREGMGLLVNELVESYVVVRVSCPLVLLERFIRTR